MRSHIFPFLTSFPVGIDAEQSKQSQASLNIDQNKEARTDGHKYNTYCMCDLCPVKILIHYTVYSVRNVTDEKLCFYLPVFMHFFNIWKNEWECSKLEKNAEIFKKSKKSKMHQSVMEIGK